ncbi:MAG: ribonuclease H-like domain-containing protein, partial [Candidatus Hydrogenedentales bacterium]
HAARRMWRRRLGDCSLQNVEREILRIERQGDVPSYLIPQIWLDYLHTRDARRLKPVFYHHQMDILSLVALTAHLAQAMAVPDGRGFAHAEDRVSLLRLHYTQKRYDEVVALADKVLDDLEDTVHRGHCLEMLATAAKRCAQWQVMESAWRRLCAEFPRHLSARLELAKHYEHRTRDLARAEAICLEAMSIYEGSRIVHEHELRAEAFAYRLERIRRKRMGRNDLLESGRCI